MRVAFVTGAAQGIGRSTAEALAAEGYALALNDLSSPAETLAAVRAGGADAIECVGDVTDERRIAQWVEAVAAGFGQVDALINNAGISLISPAESTGSSELRRVLDVNLVAPFLLAQAFGRMMLARGSGSIVNVASVAGLLGIADRAAYNASKHGLIGLTRTLAAEWGGRGVRCNAVCPGWVKTAMDDVDQARGTYTNADIEGRVPMGRFASADDVARAIVFLADPVKSAFVNGVALSVDGGWSADGSWESLRLSHQRRDSER
jgi:NAD(P)-dependent dehydrogenase (short-subunit alcohol dehydrogenase family)